MNEKANTPGTIASIGDEILGELKRRLGEAWENRLTAEHRELVAATARDAAGLAVLAMVRPGATDVIAAERKHIEAQLLSIASIQAMQAHTAFWGAAEAVLQRAIGVVIGAAL